MGFGAAQVLEGATKLSELGIDVHKNWLGNLIKNMGDPVAAQDAATRAFVLAQVGVPDLTFSEPTRAFETTYQNTSGGDLFVSINVKLEIGPVGAGTWIGGVSSVGAEIGETTPNIYVHELTLQCYLENVSNDAYIYGWKSMFFIVPKNWYYRAYTYISSGGVTPSLVDWIEWSYS